MSATATQILTASQQGTAEDYTVPKHASDRALADSYGSINAEIKRLTGYADKLKEAIKERCAETDRLGITGKLYSVTITDCSKTFLNKNLVVADMGEAWTAAHSSTTNYQMLIAKPLR